MVSSWESVVVAIGIILLFYFARRYTPKHKNLKFSKQSRIKEEVKPLEMIRNPNNSKKASSKNNATHAAANLVMHPHSFERAKKEYTLQASQFSGLYEMLYLSSSGNLTEANQEQLLKSWEDKIHSADAPNFILAWNTIIQKNCGRNFYFKGANKLKKQTNSNENDVDNILRDWLRTLLKWGLYREPRAQNQSQVQSESHGGEAVGAQELTYYWVLNGEILEEGQVRNQSLGQ